MPWTCEFSSSAIKEIKEKVNETKNDENVSLQARFNGNLLTILFLFQP